MEIPKLPPADAAPARSGLALSSEQGLPPTAAGVPLRDYADIRPLDVPAALQILLTEVRGELDAPLGAAIVQSPVQAAVELTRIYLHQLPDTSDAPEWAAVLVRVDAAMQAGIERAIGVVFQWRDTSPPVIDAVRETRSMFVAALAADASSPAWIRPEWSGLAPMLRRFWRRRRNARRRLTDPDYATGSLDDGEELT